MESGAGWSIRSGLDGAQAKTKVLFSDSGALASQKYSWRTVMILRTGLQPESGQKLRSRYHPGHALCASRGIEYDVTGDQIKQGQHIYLE